MPELYILCIEDSLHGVFHKGWRTACAALVASFFYQTKVRQSKGRKSFRGGPFKNSRLKLKILKHILVDDQNKSFAKVITDVWPDGPFLS
jgi:hypothetical protein